MNYWRKSNKSVRRIRYCHKADASKGSNIILHDSKALQLMFKSITMETRSTNLIPLCVALSYAIADTTTLVLGASIVGEIFAFVPTTTGEIGINPVENDLVNLNAYIGQIYWTDTSCITLSTYIITAIKIFTKASESVVILTLIVNCQSRHYRYRKRLY